jgi:hypothetical protein
MSSNTIEHNIKSECFSIPLRFFQAHFRENEHVDNGKGTLYYNDKHDQVFYDGHFKNGKYHGQGTLYYINGNKKYEGNWDNENIHGFGTIYDDNGDMLYCGEYNNNDFDYGKKYQNNTLVYEGFFKNYHYHGHGKLYQNGKLLYDGNFSCGLYHAYGKLYDNDNLVYDGNWSFGKFDGPGIRYIYISNNLKNKLFGKDDFNLPNDKLRYYGDFKNGQYHGYGVLSSDNSGVIHDGMWENGYSI